MFRVVPRNTFVPGFRVGLTKDPPGFAVDEHPYGNALAFGDPRGVGTEPPDFLGGRPWPARPKPPDTVPRPDPMHELPPPPPYYWPLQPGDPGWRFPLPPKQEPKPVPKPTS